MIIVSQLSYLINCTLEDIDDIHRQVHKIAEAEHGDDCYIEVNMYGQEIDVYVNDCLTYEFIAICQGEWTVLHLTTGAL